TTVCRFRHLLEEHDLGQPLFDEVQRHLAAKGLKVATGTIVDATIINAPSSTKNAEKARDPERADLLLPAGQYDRARHVAAGQDDERCRSLQLDPRSRRRNRPG